MTRNQSAKKLGVVKFDSIHEDMHSYYPTPGFSPLETATPVFLKKQTERAFSPWFSPRAS